MRALWIAAAGLLFALPAVAQSELPDGPGKEVVVKVCGNCHDYSVFTQDHNTRDRWDAIVQDMVSRGAEGTDAELDQVVSYLTAHFGPPPAGTKVNVNKASADDLVKSLAISRENAAAIVDYRAKNGPIKNLEALKGIPGIDAKKIEEKKDLIEF